MKNITKHEFIRQDIESTIEQEMSVGDRLPTETEYQEKYKVSRQTIRTALRNLENKGIIYKEHGVGSFVRVIPSKVVPRSKTIGVITTYVSDYIFPYIIRGIESELTKEGYSMILSSTNNDVDTEKSVLDKMIANGIDGLIVEPTKSSNFNKNLGSYVYLREMNIPIIMIHSYYEELQLPSVTLNDRHAGYTATKHLIENGHKRIGGIFKTDDRQGRERIKGFVEACLEFGVTYDDKDILLYETELLNDNLDLKIKEMIMNMPDVTGLVCYNDQIAIKVITKADEVHRKVPDNLSVVSHDNSILTELSEVKITSVNHPKEDLGKYAAKKLVEMISTGNHDIDSYEFEGELVIRKSVKKMKN